MVRGEGVHSGRVLRRTSATLVVLILALAVAAQQFDLGKQWFGWDSPSPVTEPAEVAPPPGLRLPRPAAASPVAEKTPGGEASPRKVRRALAGLVSDRKLGRRVSVAVEQLTDGRSVYRAGSDLVTPASTLKLLTSMAALEVLGPDHRFRTTVVSPRSPRRLVLVGGGDPFLERAPVSGVYPAHADLQTLARATARSLRSRGRTTVRLGYDTSLFTGPRVSPSWEASYVPDSVIPPISPLWTNEGRELSGAVTTDPAAVAAEQFAKALTRNKIGVRGTPQPTRAPGGADEVAAVASAPLARVVQEVLEVSDNEGAEVLLRHVAIAGGKPGSFLGGARAVRVVLGRLGVDTSQARIFDGSGLSRDTRLTTRTLLSVIELAGSDENPSLRPVVTGLPVAGFTGSLAYRFQTGDDRGLGRVRAKTGTLTGVHGLAGVVTDLDGTELAFVAIADRVKVRHTLHARTQIDEIAAALAGCSCGTT